LPSIRIKKDYVNEGHIKKSLLPFIFDESASHMQHISWHHCDVSVIINLLHNAMAIVLQISA